MNRNAGISLLRVCSMLMIVLCHYCNYIGISWLAQFLNVGVYNFLLMSGWLYSKKRIDQPKRWILLRWKKLCVPVLVWMVLVIIYAVVVEHELPPLSDVFLFLTNMQGLSWVFLKFTQIHSEGVLGGLGNLWFVTVIMLCYLILVLAKKLEERKIIQNKFLTAVISIVCFICLAFCGIQLMYFICFLIGYALGREKENIALRKYVYVTAGMIAAVAIRLAAKHFIDGTTVYDIIVVGSSHTTIAVWIFYTVRFLDEKINWFHLLAASKATQKCDELSFFIYITHYYFLAKRFNLKTRVPGLFFQTALFCTLSLITALLVKWISKQINSHILMKTEGK